MTKWNECDIRVARKRDEHANCREHITRLHRELLQQSRIRLLALVEQWRKEAALIDSFHATMALGYKVCADQLAALLPPVGRPDFVGASHGVLDEDGKN